MNNESRKTYESEFIKDYNRVIDQITEFISSNGYISVATILDYLGIIYWDLEYQLIGFDKVEPALEYARTALLQKFIKGYP